MSETTNDESSKLVDADKEVSQDSIEFSARKKREIEKWAETTALFKCRREESIMHRDYFSVEAYEKGRADREAAFQAKVLKKKDELIGIRNNFEKQFKLLTPYERRFVRLYLGYDEKTGYEMHSNAEIARLLNITEEKSEKILKNISRKLKKGDDKNESKQ